MHSTQRPDRARCWRLAWGGPGAGASGGYVRRAHSLAAAEKLQLAVCAVSARTRGWARTAPAQGSARPWSLPPVVRSVARQRTRTLPLLAASAFRWTAQRREMVDLRGGRTLAPAHRFRISTQTRRTLLRGTRLRSGLCLRVWVVYGDRRELLAAERPSDYVLWPLASGNHAVHQARRQEQFRDGTPVLRPIRCRRHE